jgi:hypothetical protein
MKSSDLKYFAKYLAENMNNIHTKEKVWDFPHTRYYTDDVYFRNGKDKSFNANVTVLKR